MASHWQEWVEPGTAEARCHEELVPSGDRYARQRAIEWWDQDRLAAATIVVVGVGALGNEVAKNLALLGIGRLLVVDGDRVEVSNLSRSVLFRETDVGRPKATVAAEALRVLEPALRVEAIVGDLEFTLGGGLLRESDLVIGCLDSVNARWALNRRCFDAGVAWLNAGINTLAGEVSLHVPGESGCYECGMTAGMWQRFHERYSCTRLLSRLPPRTLPTTIPVTAMTAGIVTQEALAWLHRQREGTAGLRPGRKVFVGVRPWSMFVVDLPWSPDCPRHAPAAIDLAMSADVTRESFDGLVGRLRLKGLAAERLQLEHPLLVALECTTCGVEHVVRPAQEVASSRMACPSCGRERVPVLIESVDAGSPMAQVPLTQLGVPPRAIVRVGTATGVAGVELQSPRQE